MRGATILVVPEFAHQMGIVPLLWLTWLHFKKGRRGVEWWLLAIAFGVSWLTDTATHWVTPWLIAGIYLVTQAWLIGAVFLSRRETLAFIGVLTAVAIAAVLWKGVSGPDVLLHTVAWLAIVGIVYPIWQLGRLRTSLLVAFGLGWLAWMFYAIDPGWTSWSAYQATRLAGILLFCLAATSPTPQLKLYRK